MRGLYAIVDIGFLSARGMDPLDYARAVLRARPAALQLRAKDLPAREILGLLRALGSMCRQAKTRLVANDRADLAVLAGCDIVHVGQGDIPPELVHRIAPRLGVGISTHDLDQLARAIAARPAYVAFGPIYETTTKKDASSVVGLDALRTAKAIAAEHRVPLVAIGGITLKRAPEVARYASCAAVIADLVPGTGKVSLREVGERASLFHAALGGGAGRIEARH